jgi:hypothetical protein
LAGTTSHFFFQSALFFTDISVTDIVTGRAKFVKEIGRLLRMNWQLDELPIVFYNEKGHLPKGRTDL